MSTALFASPSGEFIKRNDRLWMRPGRLYIPAWQFAGLDYETTTTTDIKSSGTGAGNDLAIATTNTSGVTSVAFGANADSLEHFLALPADLDLAYPIYFSVVWTANNTSGNVTWDILYKNYVAGTTVVGTAKSATTLDKTPGAHTMAGVAYTLMVTPEGRINGGKFADTTEYLQLGVVRTAATTITSALFLGLNIRYTRKFLQWGSQRAEAKAATYIASEKYAN